MENFIKQAATKPTLYFIGVTTHQSSIMRIFPEWAKYLQLGDAVIRGMNFKLHDQASKYREAVEFIKQDPLSLGALVTTHKMDLFEACRDQFDQLDEYAVLMHEISSISKSSRKLAGHAKDPISCGLALESFLPADHWDRTGAEVFIMGAGGAGLALSWYLARKQSGNSGPSGLMMSDISSRRIRELQAFHHKTGIDLPVSYHHAGADPEVNDAILGRLKTGSLIVNATGLGKDAEGSPLSGKVEFPQNAICWDFNYRGNLQFLEQARAQKHKILHIEDGWVYFMHGWTRVIAEVFQIEIPFRGPVFDALSHIALAGR